MVGAWSALVGPRPARRTKATARQPSDAASVAIHTAIDSMGGLAALQAIVRVRIAGAGYTVAGDDARAVTVFAFTETRDDRTQRLVQDVTVVTSPGVSHRTVRTLVRTPTGVRIESDGRTRLGDARALDDWFTEAPENVLLAAARAPDLATVGETGVRFTWRGRAVHVRFTARGGGIAAVELDSATTVYSRWKPVAGGARYPHQWTIAQRGLPTEAFTADRVTIVK
jgi:hypothetical protein